MACLVVLAGCGENEAAVPASGIYQMEIPEEKATWLPELELNQEAQRFRFTYDLLSSQSNSGTYRIEQDLLIATNTYHGRQFVFQIVDIKPLSFVEDQSVQTFVYDEHFGVPPISVVFSYVESYFRPKSKKKPLLSW